MPETAKVLRFPAPREAPLTQEEVLQAARTYLEGVSSEGSATRREALLKAPDVLLSVCVFLREQIDGSAQEVLKESVALYRCISATDQALGGFDEKDYFRGDAALIAATASRVLGRREDAALWLDRAEAGFRHTVNPSPLLALVTYQRLALRCEIGLYAEVVELAPMLARSFEKLSMRRERDKCVFLEGLAQKQGGDHEGALQTFQSLQDGSLADRDLGLVGMALVNLADIHAAAGRDEAASYSYGDALGLLKRANRPAAVAHLKGVMGESFRRQGRLQAGADAFRSAIDDYEILGMRTWVAYLRINLAQVLLEAGRPREAEWEVLAALPTIDEEKMVPEGFAAVALLRESVRQRKTDPKALFELRQYLQAKN